ncbi:LLM class flavin-dependent oxidoreductase [Solicola gregarius]|uniref:LLM class flavin-dependent oxidoreductase n=1 Tax=Solicola gregarius TaxID=2908642 RepID=A0AA46TLZ0_9ACTN|nr:LLM class flavin-dependent oxidoreductase [Solicola gregarius]UYM07705.1 LLM class flavin-dependent oxidoreductase [Solicola gregarius]
MTKPIELSVIAMPTGQPQWTALARRCEAIGARALLVPDHPGSGPSPYVALAAAAATTSTLRLSSYVSNAGVRHPLLLAGDVATLDVVSDGRAELAIGAGHTPAEWQMIGRDRPESRERVREFIRVAGAARALLAGESVDGASVGARSDLRLDEPVRIQQSVPMLVGGGNPDLLDWAGSNADAVGLSGLGRTLPDGHRHTVRWSTARIDAQTGRVRDAAATAGVPTPPIEALVQYVRETSDRAAAAAEIANRADASNEDVLHAPYVLLGTIEQIVEQLYAARERWGISRWAVREDGLDVAERVLAVLRA